MLSKNTKQKLIIALIGTIATGFIPGYPITAQAFTKGKVISGLTVIDKGNTENHDSPLAIDGDINTYWESSNDYRWIEVDLGGIYNLSEIKIFNKVGASYKYNIYATEDGENYNKIGYKVDDKEATVEGDSYKNLNIKAGKLRIDVTSNSISDNVNIAEIEVYGSDTGKKLPESKGISVSDFSETEWKNEFDKFENDSVYANQKTIREIEALVGRVIGEKYVDNFVFDIRDSQDGNDVFEVYSENGKIVIKGNNGVSLASGFNYYLKNYCKVSYNPIMGSNLKMPVTLPMVTDKVVVDTPYEHRYALNFCTYSYTMAFWDWNEYEEFIDWAAMNGINLMLDIVGQEEVLRRTLKEFNYTDEEIKEYISGPGYFAWFYMQNMSSFGGPLPNRWFEDRAELGRKIHDRMQSYGINPVLQGYSGGVPNDFVQKNKEAQIIDQGGWCGYERPDMLRTYVGENQRDFFQEVADVFYAKQKEVFGDVTNFYAVDPFHEGGNVGDMDNGKIYNIIQNKMIEHDEDAVWIIQNWQGNPGNNKLAGLANKDQAIVLDLFSEVTPDWKRFENNDVNWVWNMLHNFGGRMGMDAAPEKLATEIPKALKESKNMVGIGMTPEAFNTNPLAYELLFDMAWTRDQINFRQWTEDYIERRYGKVNDKISEAWDVILNTAYARRDDYYQGAAESVINSRPSLKINSASTWGHSAIKYDKKEFEKAIVLFAEVYDEFKESDAFLYDFADILKQLLANSAQEYHTSMAEAYNDKDIERFKFISGKFLELIKLQERVLSTRPEFLVGNWIEDARTMLNGADDWTKDLFEFNARALVTTWGSRKNADNGGLKDYSNRQWSGLTGDYYYDRWELWINNMTKSLENGTNAPYIDWFKMEYDWANQKSDNGFAYPTEASSESLKELANIAMDGFSVTNMDSILGEVDSQEKVNLALGKSAISDTSGSLEGNELSNLTDGKLDTYWQSDKEEYPASATIDLEGNQSVDGIEVYFRNVAGDRYLGYKIDVYSDGQWKTVKEETKETSRAVREEIEYKGIAEKVRVTLTDADLEKSPAYARPEIAEVKVYESKQAQISYENVALNKPATSNVNSQRPASNVTDGKLDTLWVANGSIFPSTVTIDLQEEYDIDHLELYFERAELPFKFKVEVEDINGNRTEVLNMTENTKPLERKYKIDVKRKVEGKITKIHATMTGKTGGEPWPAIAEIKAMETPKPEKMQYTNVAINKSVTGSNSESGKPLSNLVDGKVDTLWVSEGGRVPANATIDLGTNYFIDNIETEFEKEGLRFKFKVEVEDENGNKYTVLDKTNSEENDEKIYKADVKKVIRKIHVTLTGKGQGGAAPAAWAALAELRAFATPENMALNESTTVEATTNNENIKNIKDGDVSTSWLPAKNVDRVVIFNLGNKQDISGIEIIKESASAPLSYIIEYSEDGESWKTFADKSINEVIGDNYLDTVKSAVLGQYVRIKFVDETSDIRISEVNIYKGDVTDKLAISISKVEDVYNKATIGDKSGNYTQAAKEELGKAIEKAKNLLNKSPNSIQVAEETKALNIALNKFYKDGFVQINRTKLASLISDVDVALNAIENANTISEDEKVTIVSNLKSEQAKAKEVYKKFDIGQSEIDGAYETLKSVFDKYMDIVDVETKYEILLELANEKLNGAIVGEGNGQYSQDVVNEFKEAIASVEDEFANANTVEAIEELIVKLEKAIEDFNAAVNVVDKQGLVNVIEQAEELLNGAETTYTPEAIKALQDVLNNARNILKDEAAGNITVNETIETLVNAISDFEVSVIPNKEGLLVIINDAKNVLESVKKYNNLDKLESILKNSIVKAEEVYNNPNSLEKDVTKAINELTTVVDEAKKAINTELAKAKDTLKDKLNVAELIDGEEYTAESYDKLLDAIEKAKKVMNNPKATLEEFNEAIDLIVEAMDNLIENNVEDNNQDADSNKQENNGPEANKPNKPGTSGTTSTGDAAAVGILSMLMLGSGYTLFKKRKRK